MLNQTRLTLITLDQNCQPSSLPHRIHFSVVFIDRTLLTPGESRKVSHEEPRTANPPVLDSLC